MPNATQRRRIKLLALIFALSSSLNCAQAAFVDNQRFFAADSASGTTADPQRAQLKQLLERDEVRSQLLQLGADPSQIDQRIDRLTATELQQLNTQIDQLPAGSGFLGIAALIFVVFVITDALGATDLFTFVKPIR